MEAATKKYQPTNGEEEKKPFVIETKEQAIWAMRRIATLEKDFREEEEAGIKEIELINAWLEKQKERYEKDTEYLRYQLEQYHRKQLEKNPSLKTIRLPHGELQLRKQQSEYAKNEDDVKVWAKENRPELLMPQEPKLDWSTLKKSLQATDDGMAIDMETGTIVPSVLITKKPLKFDIKLMEV